MDSVLTIESDEAVQLAHELAELLDTNVEAAVKRALETQIAEQRKRREAAKLSAELLAIGRECAALLEPPFHSSDHADLYGDDGLPA